MIRLLAIAAATYLVALLGGITQPASTAKAPDGQQIFRFDTFGDEQLWTGTLQMHQALASVSPATALKVGLKVDVDALPPAIVDALKKDRKSTRLNSSH